MSDVRSGNSGPNVERLRASAEQALEVERNLSGYDDLPPENVNLVTWTVADGLALLDEIEELKVRDIVSRNPGIDPDEVRRYRKTGVR